MDGMKVGCDRTRKREKRAKEDARYVPHRLQVTTEALAVPKLMVDV